ncbi:hypothetical protein QQF64_036386 [Cirrhinus molitorella]|uniref:G-protein coupled receptors family 1 profile domain-containing protein n=1 Tax=Cirrhinus molitorella TaxID=172907 RepID=A0ABR3NIE8_9TELE
MSQSHSIMTSVIDAVKLREENVSYNPDRSSWRRDVYGLKATEADLLIVQRLLQRKPEESSQRVGEGRWDLFSSILTQQISRNKKKLEEVCIPVQRSSSAEAGVHVDVSASTGGTANAPVISGNTFTGPATFNLSPAGQSNKFCMLFGEAACRVLSAAYYCFMYCSILLMMSMSVEGMLGCGVSHCLFNLEEHKESHDHIHISLAAGTYKPIGSFAVYRQNTKSCISTLDQAQLNCSSLSISNETVHFIKGPVVTYIMPSFYIFIILIGLPLNALALVTFTCRIREKKPAVIYMSHLACVDLLFTLLLPLKIHYQLNASDWVFGEAVCRVLSAAHYCFMYCSILLMMSMSVDRLLAVVFPIAHLNRWRQGKPRSYAT